MSKSARKQKAQPHMSLFARMLHNEVIADRQSHMAIVTPELASKGPIVRAGAAVKRVPVIDTLLAEKVLTHEQHAMLHYYRAQASQAEDDVGEMNQIHPSKAMGGKTSHVGGFIPAKLICTPAILETGRIERDLGPDLWKLVRAVAVDDLSLSQWCIEQYGGRERRDVSGKLIAIEPADTRDVRLTLMALRYAAGAITR